MDVEQSFLIRKKKSETESPGKSSAAMTPYEKWIYSDDLRKPEIRVSPAICLIHGRRLDEPKKRSSVLSLGVYSLLLLESLNPKQSEDFNCIRWH